RIAIRLIGRLQLSQDKAGRWTAANRGAHRSERATLRTTNVVESARLARTARRAACDSNRPRPFVCRANLLAGGAKSDAGIAPGRTRPARSAGLRTNF